MKYQFLSPKGDRIAGTADLVPGVARVNVFNLDESGFIPEYAGETEMFWDSQTQVYIKGQKVYTDEEGTNWRESELLKVPDEVFQKLLSRYKKLDTLRRKLLAVATPLKKKRKR